MSNGGFVPWFTLELTYMEAVALRSQIGDLPKSRVGPRLEALYRDLDARLRLAGSPDEGPQFHVVRERPKKTPAAPKPPKPKPVRVIDESTCPACLGEGIVDGVICSQCSGFGEAGSP